MYCTPTYLHIYLPLPRNDRFYLLHSSTCALHNKIKSWTNLIQGNFTWSLEITKWVSSSSEMQSQLPTMWMSSWSYLGLSRVNYLQQASMIAQHSVLNDYLQTPINFQAFFKISNANVRNQHPPSQRIYKLDFTGKSISILPILSRPRLCSNQRTAIHKFMCHKHHQLKQFSKSQIITPKRVRKSWKLEKIFQYFSHPACNLFNDFHFNCDLFIWILEGVQFGCILTFLMVTSIMHLRQWRIGICASELFYFIHGSTHISFLCL